MSWLDKIKWDSQGLVPVITQEVGSNDVLMFAWMNREALEKTLLIGQAVYWSRSRQRLWHKGEESGHFQTIKEIRLDCDEDVLLLKVEQQDRTACHTGRHSCFFQLLTADDTSHVWRTLENDATPIDSQVLTRLAKVIQTRRNGDPESSYVARLFRKGNDAILKKIAEEAGEVIMAAKDAQHGFDTAALVNEMADLWFHCLIALSHHNLHPEQVLTELTRREGLSGLEEFALRKLKSRESKNS